MRSRDHKIEICRQAELGEGDFRIEDILYRQRAHSCMVFRLQGQVYAYLNRCVHMPRRLDCERDTIFNDAGDRLRCSMHGIVYDPVNGESISTLCNGERLQPIRVTLADGRIFFDDKHVKSVQ